MPKSKAILIFNFTSIHCISYHKIALWITFIQGLNLDVHALVDILDWVELVLPVKSTKQDTT